MSDGRLISVTCCRETADATRFYTRSEVYNLRMDHPLLQHFLPKEQAEGYVVVHGVLPHEGMGPAAAAALAKAFREEQSAAATAESGRAEPAPVAAAVGDVPAPESAEISAGVEETILTRGYQEPAPSVVEEPPATIEIPPAPAAGPEAVAAQLVRGGKKGRR